MNISKNVPKRIQTYCNNGYFILLFFSFTASAQWHNGLWTGKQANNWCLESNLGIEFTYGPPASFQGVQMAVLEGSSSISDPDGQLLFYSGGTNIWNRNHQILQNGDNIIGDTSSTQHGVFIPKPGNPNIYYFLTVNRYQALTGLTYCEIDLSLDEGLGGVTANKNIVIDPDIAGEKITAVYHADKQQVWIITHKRTGNAYAAFLISEDGISTSPVVSAGGFDFPDPLTSGSSGTNGPCSQLKISPDGTTLAAAIMTGTNKGIDLSRFNNATGNIEFITHLGGYTGQLYGLEFSPNSRFLYAADPFDLVFGGSVTQHDVTLPTPEAVADSKVAVADLGYNFYDANCAMQLAPDGRIYIRNIMGHVLNVINYPNNQGMACGFALDSFVTTNQAPYGLPTFNQSYFQSGLLTQELCFGKILFSLLRIPDADSVTWDFGDPQSGADNISESPLHTFSAAGTYTITASISSNGALQTAGTTIIVEDPDQGIITPPDMRLCENNPENFIFDLASQTAVLLGNVAAADYTVSYYTTFEGAFTGSDAVAEPESFLSQGQTIYVQIQDLNTGCVLIKEFDLIVFQKPIVHSVPNLSACGATEVAIAFDLTQQEAALLEGQQGVTVKYYLSSENAQNGINELQQPENTLNTSNPQVIYASLTNSNGCRSYTSFELEVLPLPRVSPLPELIACGQNDTAFFDLRVYQDLLSEGQEDIIFSYYTTPEGAEANINPINNPQQFENTENPQTVYLRLSNSICFAVAPFDILVDNGPLSQDLEVTQCSPANLIALTDSVTGIVPIFYATAANAMENENAISDAMDFKFTDDMKLYFILQNSVGCYAIGTLSLSMGDCGIPRGISPNGDNKNDAFDLTAFKVKSLSIFNRFGLLVYRQSLYTNQWEGQDDHGSELPTGTYYYTVEQDNGNTKTGWVYINR
jgi:gliding motility-associated-like protein